MRHYQSTVMERDLRITGTMRGQSSNHLAPPGFDVSKPWKVWTRGLAYPLQYNDSVLINSIQIEKRMF